MCTIIVLIELQIEPRLSKLHQVKHAILGNLSKRAFN
jgi:hypothetical protein